MAVPAYKAILSKSGTSTAFTNEGMTLVSGNVYRITNSALSVWDRNVTPTFTEDDGLGGRQNIPASNIKWIDYLFGMVEFNAAVTPPVQVSGNYLPMQRIAEAKSFDIELTTTMLDTTELDNPNDYRSFVYGIRNVSLSISKLYNVNDDFFSTLSNNQPIVVTIKPDPNDAQELRGWYVISGHSPSGDRDSLETLELNFQLDGEPRTNQDYKSFSWR